MQVGSATPTYEELAQIVAQQAELIVELRREIVELKAENAELKARIIDLETRLKANSRNSSKPPSSDGFMKPPVNKNRSLREKTGRKPGGQKGSKGSWLTTVDNPDEIVIHRPNSCSCGHLFSAQDGDPDSGSIESTFRQVFDLPEDIKLKATEHRALSLCCPRCGAKTRARFPAGVKASPTSYGERIRAFSSYLMVHHQHPFDRSAELLNYAFDCQISAGTLDAIVKEQARDLKDKGVIGQIAQLAREAYVLNADETGMRIAGGNAWGHTASTDKATHQAPHPNRGRKAIDEIGVLPGFEGVLCHDGLTVYNGYGSDDRHALCNVHHLREFKACIELEKAHGRQISWITELTRLLLEGKDEVDRAKTRGKTSLPRARLDYYDDEYRRLMSLGLEQTEYRKDGPQKTNNTKAQNLVLRLAKFRERVLFYLNDFKVPFDNNRAERDLRMLKVKQKISGCWRTTKGAECYLNIRSYILTAEKNGVRPLEALGMLSAGRPWMPSGLQGA